MTTTSTQPVAPTDLFAAFADLVEEHYVLAGLAPDYAHCIRTNAVRLAGLLPDVAAANTALHALVPDRHLGLRQPAPSPGPRPAGAPGGTAVAGIRWARDLPGGLALVEVHPHFGAPGIELPALQTTARRAAAARGLVLDLRSCHGGDTETASLVHGWLLGPTPVRLGRFEHRGRPSVEYTTDPGVGVHFDGPVRVLASAGTFSGGEDIAYVLQALGRARVVGERTGGGAHPVEHFPLPGGYTCQVPVARSVIDATGSNWEGVGVLPDTPCPADLALAVAHAELLSLAQWPRR